MPIYAYRCATCGHAKDVLQKLSDPVLNECPACGASTFAKQVTAAGFQLKGSGWYVTDFKGGAKPAAPAAEGAKPEAEKGDADKSDAGKGDGAKTEPAAAAPAADTKTTAKSEAAATPAPAPAPAAKPAAAPAAGSK